MQPPGYPPPQPPSPPSTGGRKVVFGLALGVLAFSFLLVIGTLVVGISRKSASNGVAVGAPLGCGCFSALFFATMTFVFFVSIFPSL